MVKEMSFWVGATILFLGAGVVLLILGVYDVINPKGGVKNLKPKDMSSQKWRAERKNRLLTYFICGVVCCVIGAGCIWIENGGLEDDKARCTICGTTEDLRHITAPPGITDTDWYCSKHYADAWQYYYGDK